MTPSDPTQLLALFRDRFEELSGEYRVLPVDVLLPEYLRRFIVSEDFRQVMIGSRGVSEEVHKAVGGVCEILSPGSSGIEAQGRAQVGITGVDAIIADTGTLVIASIEAGDRVISLLPPIHIALLFGAPIYPDLETFIKNVDPSVTYQFITGPSRTADIEKTLVLGVHGPIRLIALGPEIQQVESAE